MEVWHLFPNGNVEVANGGFRARIGYRFVPAYSQALPTGESMPLTRQHWQDMANRDGARCQFHTTREMANLAVKTAAV